MFPATGHAVLMEQPDAVNDIITRWLARFRFQTAR